jgi:geranylgeranyl pyrophosphate synthase
MDIEKKTDNQKLMPQLAVLLKNKSAAAIKLAQKRILSLNLETSKGREAIKLYAKNWTDTIHPSLIALSSEAVSPQPLDITDLQVVLLLLTGAMDIHDDIIDKSNSKGNKPTICGKFGEEMAVLLGDALLFESFTMLRNIENAFGQEHSKSIIDVIYKSIFEVGNAHLREFELRKKNTIKPIEILSVIEGKAAIFECLFKIGTIAGGGSRKQIQGFGEFGRAFGFLVMLREEFIDMYEPEELMNRVNNEYPPIPLLYALDDPSVRNIVGSLRADKISQEVIEKLIDLVYQQSGVVELKKMMLDKASTVISRLDSLEIKRESRTALANLMMGTLEDL